MMHVKRKRKVTLAAVLLGIVCVVPIASTYPIDGADQTGIERLEAARLVEAGSLPGTRLPTGATLTTNEVGLRLAARPDFRVPEPDPALGAELERLVGEEAPRYSVALLDLTDLDAPVYAEHRADVFFNPGSVGKLIVALGLFQALADRHPHDLAARRRLLRETRVRADEFILAPSHEVPIWHPGDPRVVRRKLRIGDEANLASFVDWMLSASSNSAASMVIQQLVLMRLLESEYPLAPDEIPDFLRATPRSKASDALLHALQDPLTRNGLDTARLRQGGFFTSEGKKRIPGGSSVATVGSLVDLLVRMEKGALVDPYSSLELKRYLYLTDRRIRYASSPALGAAAVFFKSGSLYRCTPEPEFVCAKYHGNVENVMNSMAIVESPAREPRLFYMAVVHSNVLRRNSAVEHQTLATRIHRLIEKRHPIPPPEQGAP